jgi:hypothetical protein
MNKTVTKFKFFNIFQYDLEEKYLRKMSNDGLHFKYAKLPGFYTFEVGEPKDIVYRLDFIREDEKDEEEYRNTLKQNGWEYITKFADFSYHIKPAEDENIELYSDKESRLAHALSMMEKTRLPILIINLCLWYNAISSTPKDFTDILATVVSAISILGVVFLFKDYTRLKNIVSNTHKA